MLLESFYVRCEVFYAGKLENSVAESEYAGYIWDNENALKCNKLTALLGMTAYKRFMQFHLLRIS